MCAVALSGNHILRIFFLLYELGIAVYFENEKIDTLTPGGEVLITILAGMAEAKRTLLHIHRS
ncbi:hypothetical protein FACS1894211_06890 [Clostridia bacterium]|nr:hypothetical protein FACS1894211_06890 [Clostridia bacterium]